MLSLIEKMFKLALQPQHAEVCSVLFDSTTVFILFKHFLLFTNFCVAINLSTVTANVVGRYILRHFQSL